MVEYFFNHLVLYHSVEYFFNQLVLYHLVVLQSLANRTIINRSAEVGFLYNLSGTFGTRLVDRVFGKYGFVFAVQP